MSRPGGSGVGGLFATQRFGVILLVPLRSGQGGNLPHLHLQVCFFYPATKYIKCHMHQQPKYLLYLLIDLCFFHS